VMFVQLTAPADVLEARLGEPTRHGHRKLTDPDRLRDLLRTFDATPLHPDDLVVDTSRTAPPEAAALVAAHMQAAR
jgi:chloramphenicol 3-O-phosphotransferase